MQDENVRAFKFDLRGYRARQKQIAGLEEEIQYCYDALSGLRGVDPSRIPIHSPRDIDHEYAIRERITVLESKLSLLRDRNGETDKVLARIDSPIREAVISIYADGRTIVSISDQMYLSHNALLHRMNRAIKKALVI